jgi:hypothetical protein
MARKITKTGQKTVKPVDLARKKYLSSKLNKWDAGNKKFG